VWFAADPRWISVGHMLQDEMMVALILVAAVRARSELALDTPVTWVFLGASTARLLGSAVLWATRRQASMGIQAGTRSPRR